MPYSHAPAPALLSVRDLVDRFGVVPALRVLHAAGFSGPAAVRALDRAGVDRLDVEAALLQVSTA